MANIVAICACVLVSFIIAYFGRLPGVDGVPADVQFSIDRAVTQTTSFFHDVRGGEFHSTETNLKSGGPQSLQKRAQAITFSNETTSSSANSTAEPSGSFPTTTASNNFTAEPAGFFATSSSVDLDEDVISEAPIYAQDTIDSPVTDSTQPTSSADISWIYYLVCGSSTSMTMGDDDIPTSQAKSVGPGPTSSPSDISAWQATIETGDSPSYSSSGLSTWPATIETGDSPDSGSSSTIPTATSSGSAPTTQATASSAPAPRRFRRDSGASSCSYMKCSGTSCQPFSSTSASSTPQPSTITAPSIAPTAPVGPTTIFSECQVCLSGTSACTSLAGCIVPTPTTVLSADTSAVTLGTLEGSALYSAITSGVDAVCPIPSTGEGSYKCDESSTATIATSVPYATQVLGEDIWAEDGSVELQIQEANYDNAQWYTMAKVILAAYAQNSTQGKCPDICRNCQTITAKRESGSGFLLPRDDLPPPPPASEQTYTICNTCSNFQLIEVNADPTVPARELSFNLRFNFGDDQNIFCGFVKDVLEFIEEVVNAATDTEGELPEELKLDERLEQMCEDDD